MDRKIAIPAGIALMVMLALAGMLAIFSFSANPAEAAITDVEIQVNGSAITDAPQVGQLLTASITGTADGVATYQWYADGTMIDGATAMQYKVKAGDKYKKLMVKVYDDGTEKAASDATMAVIVNPPPMLELIGVTGTTITLTYSEDLDPSSNNGPSLFVVKDGTAPVSVNRVEVAPTGALTTVVIETAQAVTASDLKLTYNKPASGGIQDANGAPADGFPDYPAEKMPEAPTSLKATVTTAYDATDDNITVKLEWTAPVYKGGTVITSYEYRTKVGDGDYPQDTGTPPADEWETLAGGANDDGEQEITLTGAGDNTGAGGGDDLTFQIRAVNTEGMGSTSNATVASEAPDTTVTMVVDASLKVPDKPNKNDKVVLKFTPENDIPVASWITIVLHEDFDVPGSISASNVEIDASATPTGGSPVRVVGRNPSRVDVDDTDIWEAENEDDLIRIRVPDMLTGSSDEQTGDQGIDGGAAVTVTIAKAAGIRAPKEGGKNYEIGFEAQRENINDKPKIGDLGTLVGAVNRGKTAKQAAMVYIPRLVELDDDKAGRGSVIEATAKGFAKETTVDFWRDEDGDGNRDPNEARLCSAEVSDDHIGACSFTLTNPSFVPGHGAIAAGTRNLVNARDGEGNTADIAGAVKDDQDDVIELEKSVAIAPEDGNPGDKINVQLRDFGKDGPVILVTIAGIRVTDITGDTSVDAGQTNFTIDIPSDVPTGLRVLEVTVDPNDGSKNVKDDTTINIGGANVEASPTMVLPKQEILLSGSGFAGDSYIMKAVLGGDDVYQPKAKNWTGSNLVETDANGNWNTSVEIPLSDATAAAHGTTVTLLIEDATKRVGAVELTFPERTVTMTPEEGRPGDTITLVGTGYPADDNLDVKVVYKNDQTYDEDVNPDAGGRWQHTFKVPNEGVGIPSTNIITVSFDSDDPADNSEEVVETFQHRVPGAGVSVEPAAAAEGQLVTVTVAGFSRFTDVYTVEIGGTNAQTRPEIVNTDRDGKATFQVLVPGLDVGPTTLKASIGTRDQHTTAGTAFEVLDPTGVTAGVPIPVADAFKPLIDDGKLVSVYYFNPTSKEWQWYIADPDFADSNTLTEVATGSVATYWVNVTEDAMVELGRRLFTLTCVNGDCLNPIIYP